MTPDELDELLGVYALDALDDDERGEVDRYLTDNPRARAEVDDYREVASMMAFPGEPAPTGIWERIAFVIDPGEGSAPALPALADPAVTPIADARARRRAGGRSTGAPVFQGARKWWTSTAVVCVAAAAVVLAIVTYQQHRDIDRLHAAVDAPLERALDDALKAPGSRVANLVSQTSPMTVKAVLTATGSGFLRAENLTALDTGHTYQLWGIDTSGSTPRVVSLGVLGPRPTLVTFSLNGQATTLAITVEVSGGVSVTQQQPSLAGQLV